MLPNIEKIKEFFSSSDADALLLANSRSAQEPNFHWLSALPFWHFENSIFLARRGMKPELFMPTLEPGLPLLKGIKVVRITGREMLAAKLAKELRSKKVGLDYSSISKHGFSWLRKTAKKAKFHDVSKALSELRETKTRAEIAKIKEACRIAEDCIDALAGKGVIGKREKELARSLERDALKNDAHASFPPIVASGKNSSSPHSIPSAKKIRRNEVLLVDFGVRHDNYCSDVSRTFFTGRKGSSLAGGKSISLGSGRTCKQAQSADEVYSALHSTMQAALLALKDGAAAKDVYASAEREAKKHNLKFSHALAHGVGVEVHDFPSGISKKSKWKIKQGMALAVEPATYLKRFGMRIEDCVVVGSGGCRLLTKAPKELPSV